MADEVSHRHSATGSNLYFTIRNTSRQMCNGSDWETLTVGNWGDYDIAMAESPASSYFYEGDFPAIAGNMTAGWYWVDIFDGASPAISDDLLASYFGYWDGTTFAWWSQNTQSHSTGAITASAIAGDAITSAKIADDAIAAEHIAAGAIVAATFAAGAIDAAAIADDAIDAATMADDMQAWLATNVWNAKTASYGSSGDFGTVVKDRLDGGRPDLILDTASGNTTSLVTSVGVLGTNLDAVLANTNELQTNQGNWLTATGFSTHSAADVVTALGTGSTLTTLATASAVTTIDTLLDKMAPALIGTVTGAGTGTEVFVYGDITVTYTVDEDGNRSEVAFS